MCWLSYLLKWDRKCMLKLISNSLNKLEVYLKEALKMVIYIIIIYCIIDKDKELLDKLIK
jgi:hypothetical protein